MSDVFMLSERQTACISSGLSPSHGVSRVDVRCVVSGLVSVVEHALQWKGAP